MNSKLCLGIFILFSMNALAGKIQIQNVRPENIIQKSDDEFEISEYKEFMPPEVVVQCQGEVSACKLNDKKCDENNRTKILISEKTREQSQFKLAYQCKGENPTEVNIYLFGNDFPIYQSTGKSTLAQRVLMTPMSVNAGTLDVKLKGHLIALNPDGSIFFYRRENEVVVDFKNHIIKGQKFYSYMRITESLPNLTMEGKRVLLDDKFNFIRELPWKTDVHEFLMPDQDRFVFIKYLPVKSSLGVCQIYPELKEYSKGKLVYNLTAKDVKKWDLLAGLSLRFDFKGSPCIHPFHLNSIQIVDDKHILLGVMNMHIFLEKKSKKIVWLFGGNDSQFDGTQDQLYFLSHTPRWDSENNSLTFFTNRNLSSADSTKIIEAKLDLTHKKITSWKIVADHLTPSAFMGSVEKAENEAYSVGYGQKVNPKSDDFDEILNGKKVFSVTFLKPFNSGGYRTYRD
jgi:hypothetical protein